MGVRLMPGGAWISLPAELIKEVSDRLPATDADQIHIHQLSSHWRASTAALAACRPWIVAGHDRHRNSYSAVNPVGDHSFWLPRGGKRIYARDARAPAGLPYCCGTPRGWLALTDDLQSPTRLVLWEPLSKAEIPLPTLTTVAQVFLSADPLDSPAGWMAIASQRVPGAEIGQRLFFWRPGDAAWTMQLEYPNGRIEGAAFHQDRFYISTMNMSLDIFDLQQHPPKRLRRMCLYAPLQARYPRFPGNPVPHVVACNNQMLLVMVYRGLGHAVVLVEVHRPDWDAERLDLREEKVTDLGDHSLFLGRGDSLALSAKDFPAIRRNCVYFVEHDTHNHEQWLVVFDLGSNALERIPHPQEHTEGGSKTSGWLAYSWFCPRRPSLRSRPFEVLTEHMGCRGTQDYPFILETSWIIVVSLRNKQDIQGALKPDEIAKALNLKVMNKDRHWKIVGAAPTPATDCSRVLTGWSRTSGLASTSSTETKSLCCSRLLTSFVNVDG